MSQLAGLGCAYSGCSGWKGRGEIGFERLVQITELITFHDGPSVADHAKVARFHAEPRKKARDAAGGDGLL
jgi:hypothetical protein